MSLLDSNYSPPGTTTVIILPGVEKGKKQT
jgi:hypothetical protein